MILSVFDKDIHNDLLETQREETIIYKAELKKYVRGIDTG